MRVSVDPLRDRAADLIEAARENADDALQTGGARVRGLVDAHADQASSGLDQLAERLPSLTVNTNRRRRLRKPLLFAALLVAVGVLVWSRKRAKRPAPDQDRSSESSDTPSRVKEDRIRVIPKDDGSWGLVVPGKSDIEHRTQADAIAEAKVMAKDAGGGEIVVHGLDGNPRTTVTV